MAAGCADHLLGRVSSLVATYTRRRLHHRRGVFDGRVQKKQPAPMAALISDNKQGGEALWSRRILMGERCQPLDFAGAIHYDSFGRRLARPPTPRSVSSLSCRSSASLESYLERDI